MLYKKISKNHLFLTDRETDTQILRDFPGVTGADVRLGPKILQTPSLVPCSLGHADGQCVDSFRDERYNAIKWGGRHVHIHRKRTAL